MNSGMCAAVRNLDVRVRLTLATGTVLTLTGAEVTGFAVEEGADGALLPGAVLSAGLTLDLNNDCGQWRYGGSLRGERPLVGATAETYVLLDGEALPCGVFVIQSVSAQEHGGTMRLSGRDSIAVELSGAFEDALTYPATLDQIWRHLVSQTRYAWSGSLPNGSAVVDAAPDWGGASLRRAAEWIAQAAGCFVRVGRTGLLEVLPCQAAQEEALGPDAYLALSDGFQLYGPVRGLQVTPVGAEEAFTLSDGVGETVSIEGNPLFVHGAAHLDALAAGTFAQIKGLTLNRASFTWRGDPAVGVGSRIRLTDTYGQQIPCTVTRQTMRFDQGFSADCACEVPDGEDCGVVRAITPEGGVNGSALVGTVNGGLLMAGSVAAQSIAAQAITTEKLSAGSVTAEKLSAGAVTAEKLEAQSVSAKVAEFVAAEIEKITAGEISTNDLYAAFAHVMELAAGSIQTGNIETDQLAAALANVVTLHAGTGDFDLATITNLLSNALVLQQGAANSMMIANLSVTQANLLSAVLGELVVKGSDGNYYRIAVGSDGSLSTETVTVTDGEITAGQTSGGQSIVETNLNVGDLDAQNIRAASAIVNELLVQSLSAGKITAGDAMLASATIPTLYATAIQALGGSLDLSANDTIRLLLGAKDEMQKWFTFDNERGLLIQKPAYTDADGVEHPASIWRTITDETGYHIQREDLPGYVASFARDRMAVDGVQIGDIVARKTAGGGWAWVDA